MRNDGLTKAEGAVMDALVTAWNAYAELEKQHPQDEAEFLAAVHRAQDLLAIRIVRRDYPYGWTTWVYNREEAVA